MSKLNGRGGGGGEGEGKGGEGEGEKEHPCCGNTKKEDSNYNHVMKALDAHKKAGGDFNSMVVAAIRTFLTPSADFQQSQRYISRCWIFQLF